VESILRIPGLGRLGRNRSFAYLGARTCFYDQFVASALDRGIQQVVVLGAGYDSRAWRFARPGVTFYEVDLPETQADKRSRAPAGGPIYVPADVTDSSLVDALTDAGFRSEEPTAFTAEGLTMYLTEQQVALLLRSLSALGGPGSRLAVNFGVGFEQQGSQRGRIARKLMAAGGEELRFRLSPADAPEFMKKTGWTINDVLPGPQLRDSTSAGPSWRSSTSLQVALQRKPKFSRKGDALRPTRDMQQEQARRPPAATAKPAKPRSAADTMAASDHTRAGDRAHPLGRRTTRQNDDGRHPGRSAERHVWSGGRRSGPDAHRAARARPRAAVRKSGRVVLRL
jgi:methyltransferase (TIGR00027 family)